MPQSMHPYAPTTPVLPQNKPQALSSMSTSPSLRPIHRDPAMLVVGIHGSIESAGFGAMGKTSW
jgi:hypothetical protein